MVTFGYWQVSLGILEGAFHKMYIAGATNIFSLPHWIGYASAFLGMALYWILMPKVKHLIEKERNR